MNIRTIINKLNSGYYLVIRKRFTVDMYGIQDGKLVYGYSPVPTIVHNTNTSSISILLWIAKRKGYYQDVTYSFRKKNLGMVSKSTHSG